MDVQKFQMLYQEHVEPLYRYVYSKVGNKEDAEDLTSEIFLHAMSSINHELNPQSVQKCLYLIARAIVAGYWRTHYRAPTSSLDELLETGWEGPIEEEHSISAQHVQHLLQALPEQYQEVLTCRFLLNLSLQATATRMGLTVANVKVLQFRALKHAAHLEQIIIEQRRIV